MATKKYASLSTLQTFLDKLKNLFATKVEMDKKAEVQIITQTETDSTAESIPTLRIHKLTQEQYDEQLANGAIDENALYLTPNEEIDLSPYATIEQLDTKADTEHKHEIADINNLQTSLDKIQNSLNEKVSVNRTINGKVLTSDIALSATDVGADASGSANNALSQANAYTDSVKNDLLNGAGEAYDTLKELGELIDENTDVVNALEIIATGKADANHSHDDVYYTETEVDEMMSSHTHSYDDLRNKPFYEGTDYSSILTNGASTVNFYEWGGGVYGAAVTDAPKVLTQSISHKVIWDGEEYTMTSAFASNNDAGNPITSLGAPYGDYSNYPFGIDSYQTASGTYEFSIHTNSIASTHTIDILELGSSFVTLDDRFISDNIARTFDVDTAIDGLNNNKADKIHNHAISEVVDLQTTLDTMNENLRNNTWYGTCSTAATTTEKVVATASGNFELETGNIIYVLFTYASCANATLNVDGKGAKTIKIVGNNNVSTYHWSLNEVVGFVYDGTYFRVLDGQIATTTYYGVTKLSSSTSSTSTTTAATPSAVKAAYDLADSKQDPATTLSGYGITDAYTKSDHDFVQIYDSGEITEAVNAISGINIAGYKNIKVVVQNINDGTNTTTANGAIIFMANNGTTYQFNVFNSLFGNTNGRISGGSTHFNVRDGWLVCEYSIYNINLSNKVFTDAEGGTATKLSAFSGGSVAKCTNELSTLSVTSYNQNTNCFFGVGSRVIVWGCKA